MEQPMRIASSRLVLAGALAAAGLTAAPPARAADYIIDMKGNHASINFRIKHLGFSWLTGRFDRFNGTFSYDEAAPNASKVKVEIDTSSINSNHAERDKHLKSEDFLDVSAFPKAVFESATVKSTGDGKATITGKLTLHGVTKEIAIEAEHVGGGDDPWGGVRQGFTGKTKIALKDYGIDTTKLGPGTHEVELELNVEGVAQ
jgi:polyisoprenoid-binding protein YceI